MIAGLSALAAWHALVDLSKVRLQPRLEGRGATLFLVDQGLHLAGIVTFLLVYDPEAVAALGGQLATLFPGTGIWSAR